jgi:hypothetical protein
MNQIQNALQRVSEMKEKIRILINEIEILRHEIVLKDRDLSVISWFFFYSLSLTFISARKKSKRMILPML